MMGHKEKLVGGSEFDVFTIWRKYLCYTSRPGVCKKVKRKYNKRIRYEAKHKLKGEKY